MLTVATFYRFAPLPDAAARRAPLARLGCGLGLRGSILMAPEGVNGTIAGPPEAVFATLEHIRAWPGFAELIARQSPVEAAPFGRFKVRLRPEIVTLKAPADPAARTGTHVPPTDWNALVSAPDVAVIDTRNAYEVALGSFAGALDPGTAAFSDFPAWWAANRDRLAGKRIAMFCTGGIRCEKATAWLLDQGVPEVFQLQGGILGYLAEVPEGESLWRGGCFVFDDRVALGHGLVPTGDANCPGCRHPLRPDDLTHPDFEPGVSCPRCRPGTDPARLGARRIRHGQMLAAGATRPRCSGQDRGPADPA
jgi:UPF0176 protein